jgi:hypothetical protein
MRPGVRTAAAATPEPRKIIFGAAKPCARAPRAGTKKIYCTTRSDAKRAASLSPRAWRSRAQEGRDESPHAD